MKRRLIHHRYAFTVALKRLISQPFSTLANLLVIGLSLSIPLLAASLLVSLQPVAQQIPITAEITLFTKLHIPTNEAHNLAKSLHSTYGDDIETTEVISRDQAMQRLKSSEAWASALSVLAENPLPDAIIVKLKNIPNQADRANHLAQQWLDLDLIENVQLDSEWTQRLMALLQVLRIGIGILAAIVALVVVATVFNTVRMQALALRDEIAVVRMVGATESFVRRPFLYLGAITGIISALLALALTTLALIPLNQAASQLAQTYNTQMNLTLPQLNVLITLFFIVVILAAVAARWSVSRRTHLIN